MHVDAAVVPYIDGARFYHLPDSDKDLHGVLLQKVKILAIR
jgi:hypothetical protein